VPSPSGVVDQYGVLAQMGEQRLCKATVVGSIPTFSTKHNAGIAQLVERHVANVKVAGSSPATRSKIIVRVGAQDIDPSPYTRTQIYVSGHGSVQNI
jgi:hypothetical protein